jgi:hypothetical protein
MMSHQDKFIPGREVQIFAPSGSISTTTTNAARYLVEPGVSHTRGRPYKFANSWSWQVNYQENWTFSDKLVVHFGTSSFTITTMGNVYGGGSTKDPIDDDRDACYNQALSRLNDKVRGGLDLAITLAESGSTKRMIRSVGKIISHARRIRSLGSTRDIANGWLQWQYGWRQLMQDVFNAADESQRIVTSRLQRVRGTAVKPISTSYSYKTDLYGFRWNLDGRKEGSNKCMINLVLFTPDFDLARWTSLNPVSIAWELVPYSFVVDWFIDIGSCLRNYETGLLYNTLFREGFVSELFIAEMQETIGGSGTPIADPSTSTQLQGTIFSYWIRKTFGRSLLSSYPLPRRPSFKVDMGAQRCFSAAALLRQLLK